MNLPNFLVSNFGRETLAGGGKKKKEFVCVKQKSFALDLFLMFTHLLHLEGLSVTRLPKAKSFTLDLRLMFIHLVDRVPLGRSSDLFWFCHVKSKL